LKKIHLVSGFGGARGSIPATQESEVGGTSWAEAFPRQKQALFEVSGMAQVVKLLASRP
jgi:hypothetical protein